MTTRYPLLPSERLERRRRRRLLVASLLGYGLAFALAGGMLVASRLV